MERRRSSVVAVERPDDGVLRVDDEAIRRMSVSVPEIAALTEEAKNATSREHSMTIRDAVKLYPKAIMFSVAFSTAVVMEGYDLSLMGSFFGFPPFRARYGTEVDPETGGKLIGAEWQSGISNGVQVGSIIGLYINGYISDKIGYKKTMIGSLIAMICFLFIPFFAPNIGALVAGAVLCGIPWGIFQTLTVTYASEICPVALRAFLTTYVNLCWVIGQFIAAGVLRGFLGSNSQWAYRVPFAIQWVWPVVILPFVLLAPESPWWLVRKGREDDARNSLLKLTKLNTGVPFDANEQVAMIRATNELEKALASATTYWQCFRGIDARRTEIASVVWVTQAFCGAALMGYSVQFYEQAGLPIEQSFNLNMGQYAMGAVGTIGSWFLMPHIGRRKLYIGGLLMQFLLLLGIGFAGIPEKISGQPNVGASWAVGSLLLIYTFIYDLTVGPVCYSLVAEIPSTRLKIKTVVLARNFYNMGGIVNNIIMPRMLLPTQWNWGALTGFFWAGACGILVTWCYFRLPEPKGRTYAELDVLFEHRVSARRFHKTKVDQFTGEHVDIVSMDETYDEKGAANHKEAY